MIRRVSPALLFLILGTVLIPMSCKKGGKGHFTSKPQGHAQRKINPDKSKLNDCDQLEKQREKKVKESAKRKKLITREAEKEEKEELKAEQEAEKVPVQDYRKRKIGGSGGSGAIVFLKIAAVVLLGLAAIGFAIGLVIFTLASIALSIFLVPLLITFAWFVVAGIAYAGISLVNQIRRRRMRRRKRRKQKEEEESQDQDIDENKNEQENFEEKEKLEDESE